MSLPPSRNPDIGRRRRQLAIGLVSGAGLMCGYSLMTVRESSVSPRTLMKQGDGAGRGLAIPPDARLSYTNCAAARAAGAAPVHVGDRGYAKRLDRDGDGIGCE